jgi:DNA-directed RNA polymerase III subunit RPC1
MPRLPRKTRKKNPQKNKPKKTQNRKASGTLRILHDPWYKRDARERRAHVSSAFESALQHNPALRPLLDRSLTEDVTPLRALELFRAVPDSDLDALALASRPEDLLLQVVPVPPVPIRPSVEMDGASNEDDVTMKLAQIVEVNGVVRQVREKKGGAIDWLIDCDWALPYSFWSIDHLVSIRFLLI